MKKKTPIFYLNLIAFLSILSLGVKADIAQSMQPLIDLLHYLFNELPANNPGVVYKIIILIFFNLFFLLIIRNLEKNDKIFFFDGNDPTSRKWGKLIAFILALICTLGMPQNIIDAIFQEYALFATLILFCAVPIGLWFVFKNQPKWVRGLYIFASGIMVTGLHAILGANFPTTVNAAPIISGFLDIVGIMGPIMMIIGIVLLASQGLSSAGEKLGIGNNRQNNPGTSPTKNNGGNGSQNVDNKQERARLVGLINALDLKNQQFHSQSQAFKTFVTNVISSLPSGTKITGTNKNAIFRETAALKAIVTEITDEIKAIVTDPHYNTLSRQEKNALDVICQNFNNDYADFLTSFHQAMIHI